MIRTAVAITILLIVMPPTAAVQMGHREARSCLVEVLHSEELPIGPLFHHTVKATLLVTAPGTPPFETTVVKVIPWQMPPPRRGQRERVGCDRAPLNFGLF
ncbi:hypothetical protein [Bradyrhizobium sp.]|uniref:hypothetical protein n=1 Tax=Bradyrhizobium sp. TaxID=376 RepID=UPI0025C4F63B|nr:hypothetical protein [Bradyrhizobium sp.]MBV8894551.1 hypothetical protein [Acidobacteriota bacterium]